MIRLGVDVGGTFTDVVAVDAATRTLVARLKVPTTHDAPGGVAEGIIAGIERMLREHAIDPNSVAFIAHSTTQATNALLEGDVASVGVLGLLPRFGWLARAQIRFAPFDLAPGRTFAPPFAFARAGDRAQLDRALRSLEPNDAIAVTEPFGVDDPRAERDALDAARARGFIGAAGHAVTSMYGLRARTRTVAINAAILPTMMRTAQMTKDAVLAAAIAAPLMVMRSDGGVMSVDEIATRPIWTMLSGPAAGVAGALLHENVTDGIFLEVGGTSVDCSAIRHGRPQMRPARIGGHRTMLHTIDSRTLGVAGGSIPRASPHCITGLGPRSAHIAGCRYVSFCTPAELRGARVERFSPKAGDPNDYVRLRLSDGGTATVTPTCASNLLGYVPAGAFASGNAEAARAGFDLLGEQLGCSAEEAARTMLQIAADAIRPTIEALVRDYELPRERTVLVGGGGGAASLVPFVAESLGFEHRIAKDAEVISPIGVALALVRDVVERTIVDPQPEDIVKIRREAHDKAIAAGAAPDRIEISVEIDAQHNRVRATATGATAMTDDAAHDRSSDDEQRAAAAKALGADRNASEPVAHTAMLAVFAANGSCAVVDDRAVVRITLTGARTRCVPMEHFESTLRDELEARTAFGDVGRSLPDVFVIHGGRISDLRGIGSAAAIIALAKEEVAGLHAGDPVAIITVERRA